ncbi:tgf-beta family [Holotrichia oblita]|uniref:Tgf-beta family n=1 Tax=Holotrichia oblita TaxID=644536 RepID=A0ACB9SJM4_HOLOL|nr:tgf-beta family [Holotrichia oblita]
MKMINFFETSSTLNQHTNRFFKLLILTAILLDAAVLGDRTRHRKQDLYSATLEKNSFEGSSSKTSFHSCPNCLYKTKEKDMKIESDHIRLEAIKREILSKLGLRHKPNVTHALPRDLIEKTYRTITGERQDDTLRARNSGARSANYDTVDVDDYYGKTSEIISFAEQGFRINGNRLLEFRVNAELGRNGQEFRVKSATFWLRADLRYSRNLKCKTTHVYVFKFLSPLGQDINLSSQEFSDFTEDPISIRLDETKVGWQKIDMTSMVSNWSSTSARDKLRLFVDCSCCSNWQIHILNKETDKKTDPSRPFLVIETDPTTSKRVRRRSMECSPDLGDQCCKQPFYVSFDKLGWKEWIIAPAGYYANYCKGECGPHRTPDTYATYHTHVIEQFSKNYHLSGMQPCCAPMRFSSISLIYYDMNHNIIKRDLPKMVVDECGCP